MDIPSLLSRFAVFQPRSQEEGQGLVEYAMIVLLVALVVIAALGAFGGSLGVLYESIVARLPFS